MAILGKLSRKILLLHNNAPPHRAAVTQAVIHDCGFAKLNHPPYSLDMAPSDFFLFANLKKDLRGRRFETDEELKLAVQEWFDTHPEFSREGTSKLYDRYSRVINSKGGYIE